MSILKDWKYVKELEEAVDRLESANDGLLGVIERLVDKRRADREKCEALMEELDLLRSICGLVEADVWYDKDAGQEKRLFRLTAFECHEPDNFKRLEHLVHAGIIKPEDEKRWEEAKG